MELDRLQALLVALEAEGASAGRSGARLCAGCLDLLAVDGAGIMLVDDQGHRSSLGVSDDLVGRLEELQYSLGEGPGIEAHQSRRLVWEPALATAGSARWPAFGPAAARDGFGAAFAVPLRVGAVGLGSLDLYRRRPGPLGAQQLTDALTLAGVGVALLLSLQSGKAFGGARSEIDIPGGLRAHVHQASGMISERLDIPIGDALVRLHAAAYAAERPVDDLARYIIDRRVRIDDVLE
jgi:hypothetical protein